MKAWLLWSVAAAYGAAAIVVVSNHLREAPAPSVAGWWLVAVGWAGHAVDLTARAYHADGQVTITLADSLSLASLAMGGLYLVGWRLKRDEARSVGLLILPLMALLLLISQLAPAGAPVAAETVEPLMVSHLAFSLLAYGLFTIAAVLALLESFQEHALRAKQFGPIFSMLPPLGSLEERMFWVLRLGMGLLTLSIITGAFFSHQRLGVYFPFNHKVVFTWATWLVFGALLYGHHRYGWRGRRAVRFTLSGYLLLVLAYLGVKVVTEVILA